MARELVSRESPDLVGVAGRAGPNLHNGAVVSRTVGEVEALTCGRVPLAREQSTTWAERTLVHERDTVVSGVPPSLLGKTGVASPDLHLGAARGV